MRIFRNAFEAGRWAPEAVVTIGKFNGMHRGHQWNAKDVCVGEDFCFGKDRAGSISTLRELGLRMGFRVHSVPLTHIAGEKITAEKIRALIDEGRKEKAGKLLGWKLKDHA